MTKRIEHRDEMRKELERGAIEITLIMYPDAMGPVSDGDGLLRAQLAALREFAASLEECLAAPLPPHLRAD